MYTPVCACFWWPRLVSHDRQSNGFNAKMTTCFRRMESGFHSIRTHASDRVLSQSPNILGRQVGINHMFLGFVLKQASWIWIRIQSATGAPSWASELCEKCTTTWAGRAGYRGMCNLKKKADTYFVNPRYAHPQRRVQLPFKAASTNVTRAP